MASITQSTEPFRNSISNLNKNGFIRRRLSIKSANNWGLNSNKVRVLFSCSGWGNRCWFTQLWSDLWLRNYTNISRWGDCILGVEITTGALSLDVLIVILTSFISKLTSLAPDLATNLIRLCISLIRII